MARVSNLASQYSVYDTLMRGRRARRAQRRFFEKLPTPPVQGETISTDDSGVGISGSDVGPIKFQDLTGVTGTSPFATGSFAMEPDGTVKSTADSTLNELVARGITRGEAATADSTAVRGFGMFGDPRKETSDILYSTAVSVAPPVPFVTDLIGGTTAYDPYGKEVFGPIGTLGAIARMNLRKQYDVYDKIQQNQPGYHQFYHKGQLLSIVPQKLTANISLGFGVLGTFSGDTQMMLDRYAANLGYDPKTVDLNKKAGTKGFGKELKAFVYGSGGLTEDGKFVNSKGETATTPRDIKAHLGLVNDIYGEEETLDVINSLGMSESVSNTLIDALRNGELVAKEVIVDGEVTGYATGSGGAVTTSDGKPVNQGRATFGTGVMPKSQFESIRGKIAEDKLEEDTQKNKGALDRLEQRAQASVQQAALDRPEEYQRFQEILIGGQDDDSDRGRDTGQTDADAAGDASYSSPFAEGGQAPVGPASDAPVVNQAGFVGQEPEGLPEGMTVADDVNIDVPEGTFILNAAAVEFMGSADVKKMILEAVAEAEKQGIDINQDDTKISREDLVSLAVSRGEVVIPPELAKIIGYDRLNKINNRGKAEVEKRVQENGQAPEQAVQSAATGGDTRLDLEDITHYRKFKNPNISLLNYFEQAGSAITRNTDAMEKAFSYSTNYREMHNTSDKIEDTFRHGLVGGLYGPLGRAYADFKEVEHIYGTQSAIDAYSEDNPLRGSFLNPETKKMDISELQEINKESKIDLENNKYGGILRQQNPDEKEFVRALERIMDIVRTEGIGNVPSLYDENGKEVRLQLSTAP